MLVQSVYSHGLALSLMKFEKYVRMNYFFMGDYLHLGKMEYLWPISTHPFLYGSYATAAYLVARKIILPDLTTEVKYGKIQKIFIMATAGFVWTRLQQRLSEFHFLVLLLSYLHYLVTLSIASVVAATFDKAFLKVKTE
ncbi:unnamed protein product [Bursaphelenchus okinawaensis]|uniref:Uncharacterized protein n=1 Tax=Bursaphelenchus okinawaensis TaxID=465554 RepID=A0A811KGT7_9BILA|nr:unnamed protein product [Bursaphelenchus okinawaensis]CAG9102001.1 unnamed protein product [Bursaphelenchus okinawaensis]